jgi:hypothetical protein
MAMPVPVPNAVPNTAMRWHLLPQLEQDLFRRSFRERLSGDAIAIAA